MSAPSPLSGKASSTWRESSRLAEVQDHGHAISVRSQSSPPSKDKRKDVRKVPLPLLYSTPVGLRVQGETMQEKQRQGFLEQEKLWLATATAKYYL